MAYAEAARGELTAKLWLFLLKAGGRWSSSDVAKGVGASPIEASQFLSAMTRTGSVRQFPVPGKSKRFRYGVTGDCKVPQTATVQQVAEGLAAQGVEDEEEVAP